MHQPKPDQSCQPTTRNDTCKDGLLGHLIVDVKWERIVFLRKLYDLFARDVVRLKFKHVPRISKVNFSSIFEPRMAS